MLIEKYIDIALLWQNAHRYITVSKIPAVRQCYTVGVRYQKSFIICKHLFFNEIVKILKLLNIKLT